MLSYHSVYLRSRSERGMYSENIVRLMAEGPMDVFRFRRLERMCFVLTTT